MKYIKYFKIFEDNTAEFKGKNIDHIEDMFMWVVDKWDLFSFGKHMGYESEDVENEDAEWSNAKWVAREDGKDIIYYIIKNDNNGVILNIEPTDESGEKELNDEFNKDIKKFVKVLIKRGFKVDTDYNPDYIVMTIEK